MSLITITSDFGYKDFYVGAIKGMLYKYLGDPKILDVSHSVTPFDVFEAAYVLGCAYRNFPNDTINIISVNVESGEEARNLLVRKHNQWFIGPDNGLFSLLFKTEPDEMYELPNIMNGLATFPAAFYAQIASMLVKGEPANALGNKTGQYRQSLSLQPVVGERLMRGHIIYVDQYENAVTNITKQLFTEVADQREFQLSFRTGQIYNLSPNYNDVPNGELLCLFNAFDYLEIAINRGKASSLMGLKKNDKLQIEFS